MANLTDKTPLPGGFRAAGVVAGIKKNGGRDVALIVSDRDCNAAAVFTQNKVAAAPVLRGRKQMETHADRIRAVVINAGCANACTGDEGAHNAAETGEIARLELRLPDPAQIFSMSTGVIGVQLPMDKLRRGILEASKSLSPDNLNDAAYAIMTTDTLPKVITREVVTDAGAYRISGIAKGAGMIHPNMATMLSVIVTDAVVGVPRLKLSARGGPCFI